MATWPASLPQKPLQDGYKIKGQDVIVRTSVDAKGAPDIVRRRVSAGVLLNNWQFLMTQTQYDTFKDFFETDIEAGALSFDFTDPLDNTNTLSVRIVGPYGARIAGGLYLRVSFQVEILP